MNKPPAKTQQPRISRITAKRLYNTGNYEHVSYELTVDIPEGNSASMVITGVERILDALRPESKVCVDSHIELQRKKTQIDHMLVELKSKGDDEFIRSHGYFEGTPLEYIARCEKSFGDANEKRKAWEAKAAKARELFDDLGGAAVWKDAKLDWENDYEDL